MYWEEFIACLPSSCVLVKQIPHENRLVLSNQLPHAEYLETWHAQHPGIVIHIDFLWNGLSKGMDGPIDGATWSACLHRAIRSNRTITNINNDNKNNKNKNVMCLSSSSSSSSLLSHNHFGCTEMDILICSVSVVTWVSDTILDRYCCVSEREFASALLHFLHLSKYEYLLDIHSGIYQTIPPPFVKPTEPTCTEMWTVLAVLGNTAMMACKEKECKTSVNNYY
jgi:hypothetical protein